MSFKLFKKNSKQNFNRTTDSFVVHTNDIVNLTYMPSKACYASKLSEDFNVKLRYIKARINEAHESVIEHANVCMMLLLPLGSAVEFVEIANGFRYLNVETIITDRSMRILIGGSIRGYKHLLREILPQHNTIIMMIKRRLYECCYREFFVDLIEMGIMKDQFIDPGVDRSDVYDIDRDDLTLEELTELERKINSQNFCNPVLTKHEDKINILNADSIQAIYDKVKGYGFTMEQCLSMASVTILFKDMSAIITRELNRHRNAITQESQRYVDCSNSGFNNPLQFKPDKYDQNATYKILGVEGTAQELGEMLCGAYTELREQGMEKEDARGYLPSNVKSTKVFMTFTYRSLIAFMHLRTDKAAQAEIRQYAEYVYEAFSEYVSQNIPSFNDDIYYYLIPRCMKTESEEYILNDVDEPIEEIVISDEPIEDTVSTDSEINQDENAKMLQEEMGLQKFDSSKYAFTREDDTVIKTAESGKKDV